MLCEVSLCMRQEARDIYSRRNHTVILLLTPVMCITAPSCRQSRASGLTGNAVSLYMQGKSAAAPATVCGMGLIFTS